MYKFLDVGCKTGGSFPIATQFGHKIEEGVGIDINRIHLEEAKKKGLDCIYGDATSIPFKDGLFELVICFHMLEHSLSDMEFYKAFDELMRVSKKYVYIAFPFFDEDEYLHSLGLKTFYSDWTGHTCMMKLNNFIKYLNFQKLNYDLTYVKKLIDSNATEIHSINSPKDSLDYDSAIHPPKPFVVFDRDVYREFFVIITK